MMNRRRSSKRANRSSTARLAGGLLGLSLTIGGASAANAGMTLETALQAPTHTIVLRDGRELTIEILEEHEDHVIANVVVAGISAQRTFSRSDILVMTELDPSSLIQEEEPEYGNRIYVARLPGQFGLDITTVSIQRLLDDAMKKDATHVVFYTDMDWLQAPFVLAERHDDDHNFETFFQAEQMMPIVAPHITHPNRKSELPEIIFWVNRAMGGMSFLPMTSQNVFFTSDGAMGGIGNLDAIFAGEELAFAKKQQGLRRTAVEGWLLAGGHDAEIGKAMMRKGYVLSYRIRGGEVEYLEDYPSADAAGGWTLLTDDGEGDNEDTDAEIVRQQGNDTLTLRSRVAEQIGFSQGTFDDINDITDHLGISEDATILDDGDDDGFADRATAILDRYREGIERSRRDYLAALRELGEADTPGRRIQKLRELIAILDRYPEVFDPNGQLRSNWRLQIEQARNEQRLRGTNRDRGTNRRGNGGG